MAVNSKYGDFLDHMNFFREKKIALIPPPHKEYYNLTEIDLAQRILLPSLFKMVGIEAFDLPYTFFNALLKPKDA